jgi:hypothetical protein
VRFRGFSLSNIPADINSLIYGRGDANVAGIASEERQILLTNGLVRLPHQYPHMTLLHIDWRMRREPCDGNSATPTYVPPA